MPTVRTVGVMGDHRTYEWVCCLRAVNTTDFMTADWHQMPYEARAERFRQWRVSRWRCLQTANGSTRCSGSKESKTFVFMFPVSEPSVPLYSLLFAKRPKLA